jgi:hypothetical protein
MESSEQSLERVLQNLFPYKDSTWVTESAQNLVRYLQHVEALFQAISSDEARMRQLADLTDLDRLATLKETEPANPISPLHA